MVLMGRALLAMGLHHQWEEELPGEGETGQMSFSPGPDPLICRASEVMEVLM